MKSRPPSNRKPKTAFLFPGSGAQYPGMGRGLRDAFPAVEQNLRSINLAIGRDIAAAMDGPEALLFPPVDSPDPTVFMEVTMALALAVGRSLAAAGARPDFAAGRSMGEYSAAAFAGVFSDADCFSMVRYVTLNGQQDCLDSPSFLVTVYGLDRRELAAAARQVELGGELCEVVAFYDKARLGVAGLRKAALPLLRAALAPHRHRISLSREVGAFHTTLFNRLSARAAVYFDGVKFAPPAIPLYMNVDGKRELAPAGLKRKLAAALVRPVLWQETIAALLRAGTRTFVELAPGAMLTEFVCELPADAEVLRTDTPENYRRALARLKAGCR
ncbi:MAG: ACP S-malonyltransferase [Elusimicrobiales bacterium]|nr:ACP S-malonyltransferase [Elusimicrobiales bacterium]